MVDVRLMAFFNAVDLALILTDRLTEYPLTKLFGGVLLIEHCSLRWLVDLNVSVHDVATPIHINR